MISLRESKWNFPFTFLIFWNLFSVLLWERRCVVPSESLDFFSVPLPKLNKLVSNYANYRTPNTSVTILIYKKIIYYYFLDIIEIFLECNRIYFLYNIKLYLKRKKLFSNTELHPYRLFYYKYFTRSCNCGNVLCNKHLSNWHKQIAFF